MVDLFGEFVIDVVGFEVWEYEYVCVVVDL